MLRRLFEGRRVGVALALLLIGFGVVLQLEVRERGRPNGTLRDVATLRGRSDLNVLFVLVDTLRADRLGCYGYPRPTSPVIDALAASGVRFERVVSQSSWTKASMASLWTSTYPATNGVLRYPHALPDAAVLPAEVLAAHGFRTAGIWRNGWVAANFGFQQGFGLYLEPAPGRPLEGTDPRSSAGRLTGSDADVTSSAREFLRSAAGERWFLYLHYMDVHQYAYDADSALFGTSYSDIYDNAIHWVDANIGSLLAELESLGLLDRTLVAIASDHGESFYEHGSEGHGRNLYREVVETPLVLSLPFRLPGGAVVEAPVENVDLWPTLLDLVGAPDLPGAEGRSLVGSIEAAAQGAAGEPPERLLFSHLDRTWGRMDREPVPLVAVTSGRYRLIHHPSAASAPELYDLEADPTEQRNIAGARAEVVDVLRAQAEDYLRRPGAPWGRAREVEIDELRLGQLRALGYLDRPPPGPRD